MLRLKNVNLIFSTVSFLGYVNAQDWMQMPAPTNLKQLQPFLGFASFYRRFIRNYSRLAALLTALTSTSTPFRWTLEVETPFMELKCHFVAAPVPIQPDTALQFIAEADASDTGVGAALSQ